MRKLSISRLLTCAMVVMMVFSVFTITSSASAVDSSFTYSLYGGDEFKTDFRVKNNDSSAYMKCTYLVGGNGYYTTSIFGGFPDSEAYDCSGGYHYYFEQGYARFMYNFVNESSFPLAAVFANEWNSGLYAEGVWSPDSVPDSGVLPGSDYIR